MGLDISHYQACLQKQREFISLDFFESNQSNVEFTWFEPFFQAIEYKSYQGEIWMTTNASVYQKFKDRKSEKQEKEWFMISLNQPNKYSKVLYHKDPETLHKMAIHQAEITETNTNCRKSPKEFHHFHELNYEDEYLSTGWILRSYYLWKKDFGFYYQELGYQRKGVNTQFYKYFNPYTGYILYARKEDFKSLKKCLPSSNGLNLDKFEEGRSFLWMSA